jgi:ubiquinone/menaquinone biosynthesis C-methylase UbiE
MRSGSFDLVTLVLGLKFMEDPLAALREVRRGENPPANHGAS